MDKKYTDSGKLRLFPTIEEAKTSSLDIAKNKLLTTIGIYKQMPYEYQEYSHEDSYFGVNDEANFDAAILEYQTTKDLFFEVTIVAGKS